MDNLVYQMPTVSKKELDTLVAYLDENCPNDLEEFLGRVKEGDVIELENED